MSRPGSAAPFRSKRHHALSQQHPPDRYCCDGRCNDNQGRGECPAIWKRPAPPRPQPVSFAGRARRWFARLALHFGGRR